MSMLILWFIMWDIERHRPLTDPGNMHGAVVAATFSRTGKQEHRGFSRLSFLQAGFVFEPCELKAQEIVNSLNGNLHR